MGPSVAFTKKQQCFFVNKNNNCWLLRYNEQPAYFQNATLVHDVDVACVAEDPIAFLLRQLPDDPERGEMGEAFVDGGRGDTRVPCQKSRRGDGVLQQHLVDRQRGRSRPAQTFYFLPILIRHA